MGQNLQLRFNLMMNVMVDKLAKDFPFLKKCLMQYLRFYLVTQSQINESLFKIKTKKYF